jgi:hypothetical protein
MGNPQFRYFDLNNNVYTIDKLKVEFEPLTKEKSFTGKYDGGKATKGKLTQKNHDKLSSKIDTILDSKSLRIKHRSGVCGMLIVYGEEKTKRVIIPESSEQGKIDELLRNACGLD